MIVDHVSAPPSFPSSAAELAPLAPIALDGRMLILLPGRSFVGVAERLPGVGLETRGRMEARWMRDAWGAGRGPVPVYFR